MEIAALSSETFMVFNIAIEASGAMLCLLGIVLVATFRSAVEPWARQHFYLFFFLLDVDLVCIAARDYLLGRAGLDIWLYVLNFAHLLISPSLAFAISYYMVDIVEQQRRRRWCPRLLLRILLALHVALLAFGQLPFRLYFSVTDGVIVYNPHYILLVLRAACPLVLNLAFLLRERDCFTLRERHAFWLYIILPGCALPLGVLVDTHMIVYSTYLAGFTMFAVVLADQLERYSQQEKKQAELRTAIMLSQIQPHFLFNSLNVILDLCYTDPMRAARATERFSTYLRRNIDAIKAEKPVAFADELEHTKTYVELEKMRFLDQLTVNWNIECADFRIPSLTLQPLVENAVRHGVRQKENGGTVTVRAWDAGDNYEISVTDDGLGFDPEKTPDDGRSHIGLQNVRERLRRISGGDLRIDSVIGEGSTVTIVLPKENDKIA